MTFTSAGRRLASTLVPARRPGPALLFLHGFRSDRGGYLPRAEAFDGTSLAFDLSGHGESDGTLESLTRRDHLADALAAYDVLAAAEGVDPARIGVCGASYGGYLAALLTGARPVARVLMRAPALYDDGDFDEPLSASRRPAVDTALVERSLGRFTGDTLILESSNDEVIPHAMIEQYLRIAPRAQHRYLQGAAHGLSDPAWEQTFRDTIAEWFAAL